MQRYAKQVKMKEERIEIKDLKGLVISCADCNLVYCTTGAPEATNTIGKSSHLEAVGIAVRPSQGTIYQVTLPDKAVEVLQGTLKEKEKAEPEINFIDLAS